MWKVILQEMIEGLSKIRGQWRKGGGPALRLSGNKNT
jgi:hypothetical protein